MALKLSIPTSNVGVPFFEAYARITNFTGNKGQIQYQVAVNASQEAREANAQVVDQHVFFCETPAGPLLDALYADLKQRPGFEGAEDC